MKHMTEGHVEMSHGKDTRSTTGKGASSRAAFQRTQLKMLAVGKSVQLSCGSQGACKEDHPQNSPTLPYHLTTAVFVCFKFP